MADVGLRVWDYYYAQRESVNQVLNQVLKQANRRERSTLDMTMSKSFGTNSQHILLDE
jgi:hypothetical protein